MLEKQAYCEAEHEKSTPQVRLNGRVTFDRQIEVPSPSFFFFNKNEEKQSFADWLIELANRGFGMSTESLNQRKSSWTRT